MILWDDKYVELISLFQLGTHLINSVCFQVKKTVNNI